MYNIDTWEQAAFYLCGFDRVWRGNYFRGDPIKRMEVEVRVGKLKNGKAAYKGESHRRRGKTGKHRKLGGKSK